MIPWTEVQLFVVALGDDIAQGDRVPGRIVALDVYRRDGRVVGMPLGAEVDAIDWTGLDEAIAWLDAEDLVLPGAWLMPCRRRRRSRIEQHLRDLEADANRGRVAIYLPAQVDPSSPEALHARPAGYAARAEGAPVVRLPAFDGEPGATGE